MDARIKVHGLNHPGIILKSSIIPIANAILVVIKMLIISRFPVMKYNTNSPMMMLNNNIGPAGLGTFGLFGLWLSFTTFPLVFRNFMNFGIRVTFIRNATTDAIIVPINNSSK